MIDLKKHLAFVKSATYRNRAGKLYVRVTYRRDGETGSIEGRYSLHRCVRELLASKWPKVYCTSGGPYDSTFRLNP